MRIAISGSKGQLGLALQEVLGRPDGPGDATLLLDLPEHDITDLAATTAAIAAFRPQVIIHGAALTDVDRCEREPDLAYRVNALGTRNLAVAAQQVGAAMVYVSTDYVFPGRPEPYWEYDRPEPLSVYARTKWYGEQIVRDLLPRHYIARTAWMYGRGPRNFVRTVLRLADERGAMQMVTDEVGSPTYALHLARALERLVRTDAYGIYHLANAGVCSRYEWACKVLRLAGREGVEVTPATNYRRLARVPSRVELQNASGEAIGIAMPPWQEALAEYLARGLDG
jgi:dTDP-4-dehydrorhamnose reductase